MSYVDDRTRNQVIGTLRQVRFSGVDPDTKRNPVSEILAKRLYFAGDFPRL